MVDVRLGAGERQDYTTQTATEGGQLPVVVCRVKRLPNPNAHNVYYVKSDSGHRSHPLSRLTLCWPSHVLKSHLASALGHAWKAPELLLFA